MGKNKLMGERCSRNFIVFAYGGAQALQRCGEKQTVEEAVTSVKMDLIGRVSDGERDGVEHEAKV